MELGKPSFSDPQLQLFKVKFTNHHKNCPVKIRWETIHVNSSKYLSAKCWLTTKEKNSNFIMKKPCSYIPSTKWSKLTLYANQTWGHITSMRSCPKSTIWILSWERDNPNWGTVYKINGQHSLEVSGSQRQRKTRNCSISEDTTETWQMTLICDPGLNSRLEKCH